MSCCAAALAEGAAVCLPVVLQLPTFPCCHLSFVLKAKSRHFEEAVTDIKRGLSSVSAKRAVQIATPSQVLPTGNAVVDDKGRLVAGRLEEEASMVYGRQ